MGLYVCNDGTNTTFQVADVMPDSPTLTCRDAKATEQKLYDANVELTKKVSAKDAEIAGLKATPKADNALAARLAANASGDWWAGQTLETLADGSLAYPIAKKIIETGGIGKTGIFGGLGAVVANGLGQYVKLNDKVATGELTKDQAISVGLDEGTDNLSSLVTATTTVAAIGLKGGIGFFTGLALTAAGDVMGQTDEGLINSENFQAGMRLMINASTVSKAVTVAKDAAIASNSLSALSAAGSVGVKSVSRRLVGSTFIGAAICGGLNLLDYYRDVENGVDPETARNDALFDFAVSAGSLVAGTALVAMVGVAGAPAFALATVGGLLVSCGAYALKAAYEK